MSFKYACSTEKYAFKLPVSAPSVCSICVFVSPNAPFAVMESALATLSGETSGFASTIAFCRSFMPKPVSAVAVSCTTVVS